MMAVPTHFFKVVLAEPKDPSSRSAPRAIVGAFVMPNRPIDPTTPLAAFAVPLSALEEVAGTHFFPKALNERARAAIDDASLQWQLLGRLEAPRLLSPTLPLLLPPAGGGEGQAAMGVSGQRQTWLPRPAGEGLQHICELDRCRLPAERWWEASKAAKKTLRRTKSSPVL